jgi:uncharacterized membrane protein
MDTFPVSPEALLGIAVGFGLAAAAGFRVFVPLLAAAIAAKTGVLTLSPGFGWLATTLAALGTATVLEVGAYSVPWLDQLLDLIATPAAMLAGMLAAASVVVDVPPLLKWSAVILAGGAAGMTQGATVFTRFKSTTLTGGAGNPVVSGLELVSAVITSALAIFLPVLTLIAVLLLFVIFTRRVRTPRGAEGGGGAAQGASGALGAPEFGLIGAAQEKSWR